MRMEHHTKVIERRNMLVQHAAMATDVRHIDPTHHIKTVEQLETTGVLRNEMEHRIEKVEMVDHARSRRTVDQGPLELIEDPIRPVTINQMIDAAPAVHSAKMMVPIDVFHSDPTHPIQ